MNLFLPSFPFGLVVVLSFFGLTCNLVAYVFEKNRRVYGLIIKNIIFIFLMTCSLIVQLILPKNYQYLLGILDFIILTTNKVCMFTMISIYIQQRCLAILKNWERIGGYIGHVSIITIVIVNSLSDPIIDLVDNPILSTVVKIWSIIPLACFFYNINKVYQIVRSSNSLNSHHRLIEQMSIVSLIFCPLLMLFYLIVATAIKEYNYHWVSIILFGLFADITELLTLISKFYYTTSTVIWLTE